MYQRSSAPDDILRIASAVCYAYANKYEDTPYMDILHQNQGTVFT